MCTLWGERSGNWGERKSIMKWLLFASRELSDENTPVVSVALARMLPTMSDC